MRHFIFAAALALAACGVPTNGPASTPQTNVPPVAAGGGKPGAEPVVAGKPGAPAPTNFAAMLVGRWGDNGDCAKDVTFRPDGTFHSYTGGDGAWSLDGDQLTMSGQAGSFVLRIRWTDANHMQVTNPDNSVGMSQRC